MKPVSVAATSFAVLLLVSSCRSTVARNWRDIEYVHHYDEIDTLAILYLQQQDMMYKSQIDKSGVLYLEGPSPGSPLSRHPTTIAPSPSPSAHPTKSPTYTPTSTPTSQPTESPSRRPTNHPTIDPYKDHEPLENPQSWYFNYDETSRFGPGKGDVTLIQNTNGYFEVSYKSENWGQVSTPPNSYWNEFTDDGFGPWKGLLQGHDPLKNRCSTGRQQSPIDVWRNEAVCHERHQIRSLPGDFKLTSNQIKTSIESNKFRIRYDRRPCSNLTLSACQEPDPPHADFPYGWGGFADVLHIDFKIKSEHFLLGEQFDGEMQIFHIHPGRRRLAALTVLIRAKENGHNYYFEEIIRAFGKEFNRNAAMCHRRILRKHRGVDDDTRSLNGDNAIIFPDYLSWARNTTSNGNSFQFTDDIWNPYHEMLIPTIHFYRYDGSITEPPCGEFVSWWIADTPMTISVYQLEQLKTMLFTNVDENCRRTGLQFHRSVARPVQASNDRPIWQCTSNEFGPDL